MVLGRDFIVSNYPRLPGRALPRPSPARENPPQEGSVSCCPVRLSPSFLPSRQRRRPFPSDHRHLHRTSRAPLPRTRRPGARAGGSSPLPAPPVCVMGWGSAGGEDRAGQPLGRAQHLPHLSSPKDGCTAERLGRPRGHRLLRPRWKAASPWSSGACWPRGASLFSGE